MRICHGIQCESAQSTPRCLFQFMVHCGRLVKLALVSAMSNQGLVLWDPTKTETDNVTRFGSFIVTREFRAYGNQKSHPTSGL